MSQPLKRSIVATRVATKVIAPLVMGLFLSACIFGNSPEKLNRQIDSGDAAKALSTLEEKLTQYPDDPAMNLLAIKARFALCRQRDCISEISGTLPPLLAGLPKLATHVAGPVTLAKDVSPLTLEGVFSNAMRDYQSNKSQPDGVLAVYNSAPQALQPKLASGLFRPALSATRRGETDTAAGLLITLGKAENLPTTYTYAAQMFAAMLTNQPDMRDTNLIALRSVSAPPLPEGAAAFFPWALLAQGRSGTVSGSSSISGTTAAQVLSTLPDRLKSLKLPDILTQDAMGAIAQELVATASDTTATTQWQSGWQGTPQGLQLALQGMALNLDPNQPKLWATYLPTLVSATIADHPVSGTEPDLAATSIPAFTMQASAVSSASTPQIAGQLLHAAHRLTAYPAVATPLATFASRLALTKQQQIDLEKLSQSLLVRAAEKGDVTSTLAIAETLPGVAQNNRQSVVPLLVSYIRNNLRDGNFAAATNTADLLNKTLEMDIEFGPLVLEEFADDLKRRKIPEQLNADTPEVLLQPSSTVVIELGPLYDFMEDYFKDQPKVLTAQLTTLVAGATGTYGQATAMYRLGSYFPEATLSADKQQEWLTASLEQSLLADTKLDGLQLAETAAKLSLVHPTLNLAPLMETALHRTATLEEQRNLWQAASPQVREVLRAIRPEFVALMQGIDATADGRLNTAATAFADISEPQWLTEAKPFIEQFNERLLTLSGIYVPVSAAPGYKTAAILLAPSGLTGGRLSDVSVTFISRIGTLTEPEAATLRTNTAATHRLSLPVIYNFDTRSLAISPQAVAQAPQGGSFATTFGSIRNLKLAGEGTTPTLTVTNADGSATPFIRTLIDPTLPLRPDGTYLLQSRLGKTVSTTQNILPPGSMLTFSTEDALQPTPADADTTAKAIYPLSGSVRHPASASPLTFTGFFEPATFTATFLFNYPLPQSAQPARAAVRCQALAGPIVCGAHNLNSARQAYAALVGGMQTRESAAAAAAARATLNTTSANRLLAAAVPEIPTATSPTTTATVTSTTLTVSSTAGLALPTSLTTVSASTVSATLVTSVTITSTTLGVNSPSTLVSNLLPAPKLTDSDDDEEEDAPTTTAPVKPSSTEPELGAFVNTSTSRASTTTPATGTEGDTTPGAFINHSGANLSSPTAH